MRHRDSGRQGEGEGAGGRDLGHQEEGLIHLHDKDGFEVRVGVQSLGVAVVRLLPPSGPVFFPGKHSITGESASAIRGRRNKHPVSAWEERQRGGKAKWERRASGGDDALGSADAVPEGFVACFLGGVLQLEALEALLEDGAAVGVAAEGLLVDPQRHVHVAAEVKGVGPELWWGAELGWVGGLRSRE